MKPSERLNGAGYMITALIIFFIAGYILFPLYSLVKESIAALSYTFPSTVSLINSVVLSLITVIGGCIAGIYFAYIFHFRNFAFKNFIYTLLIVPIAMPPLVGVVGFLFLLSDSGLVTKIIQKIFHLQYAPFSFDGWSAIIIIHIYSFYPLFLLFISSALKKVDANVVDASHSLGAGKYMTFRRVILPQLIPSIIGASVLVFMASMASFSAPFIFGGNTRFLTTEIYYAKINGDNSLASFLSVILCLISVLFLSLLGIFRKRYSYIQRSKGTTRQISFIRKKRDKLNAVPVFLFSALIVLPIAALAYLSVIPEGSLMRDYFKESFTLSNYIRIFSSREFFEPFSNSLKMSLIAVALTITIGLGAAFMITRKKIRGGDIIEKLLSIPYGIPGTVIALGFIISFSSPVLFTFFVPLVGTFWIIPLAYTVRNVPIMTQSSIAGLNALDPSLEEASASLGAGGVMTFRKITAPLIYPSVFHGSLLVFINSVGEFVSTILLYTFSTKTISVEIYSQLRLYNTGAAASYGIILFLMVMMIVYYSRKTLDKAAF